MKDRVIKNLLTQGELRRKTKRLLAHDLSFLVFLTFITCTVFKTYTIFLTSMFFRLCYNCQLLSILGCNVTLSSQTSLLESADTTSKDYLPVKTSDTLARPLSTSMLCKTFIYWHIIKPISFSIFCEADIYQYFFARPISTGNLQHEITPSNIV